MSGPLPQPKTETVVPTETSKTADKEQDSCHFHPAKAVDPWATLYDNLRKADDSQCETWKDEVDNLLILAGLFSAVVTAFVIETYRNLLPDPNASMINLLTIIASREGGTNSSIGLQSTSGNLIQNQFIPTPAAVQVNIFFFISLVLSLGTALIGIVCLQWLRQHRSYPERLSPEQRVAFLNMRITSLQQWRVHVILKSLPLLLQAALIMFFIGLIDFIWHIHRTVLIPVGALVAAILLFLILTTILPTLQLFFLHHSQRFGHQGIPVGCPYKSPQASAFCLLITSSQFIFTLSSGLFLSVYYALAPFYHIPAVLCMTPVRLWNFVGDIIKRKKNFPHLNHSQYYQRQIKHYYGQRMQVVTGFKVMVRQMFGYLHVPNIPSITIDVLCQAGKKDSWDSFDESWITIRDKYFRYKCSPQSWLYRTRGDPNLHTTHYYDAMHGLRRLVEELNFSIEDDLLRAATIRCVQAPPWVPHGNPTINSSERNDPVTIFKTRNQYLSVIMQVNPELSTTSLSDILASEEKLSEDMLMDESTCVFLKFVKSSLTKNAQTGGEASRELSKTFAKSQLRLLNSLYRRRFALKSNALKSEGGLVIPHVIQPKALFETSEVYQTDEPFIYQWAIAVHLFFKLLVKESNAMTDGGRTPDLNPFIPESYNTDSDSEDAMSDRFDPESDRDTDTFVALPVSQSLLTDFCKQIWIWCNWKSERGKFYECTITECTDGLKFIKDSVNTIVESKTSHQLSHRLFLCASYYVYLISKKSPDSSDILNAAEEAHAELKRYKDSVWSGDVKKEWEGPNYALIKSTAWNLDTSEADSFYELFSEEWWEDWSWLSFSTEINAPGRNFSVAPKPSNDTGKQFTGNATVEKDQDESYTSAIPTVLNDSVHVQRSNTFVVNKFGLSNLLGETKLGKKLPGMNLDADKQV